MQTNPQTPGLLPKLRDLKISKEDVTSWMRLPETRLFFKGLVERYKDLQIAAVGAYDRENSGKTAMALAELAGKINAYSEIVTAAQGSKEEQVELFRKEDVEELFDNDNG